MCDDTVRDGADTRTILEDNSQCLNNDCDTDYRFGMNENNQYYSDCKKRPRNKGLFTADQVFIVSFIVIVKLTCLNILFIN